MTIKNVISAIIKTTTGIMIFNFFIASLYNIRLTNILTKKYYK